ncbi:hypothetical protein [Negadavirga shengliensis]|uniref:Uncharacterized protein n=1 Tax=Negadavirga shengliensis TaxID=1389218 RepID=A0ABV9T2D3_9BACT
MKALFPNEFVNILKLSITLFATGYLIYQGTEVKNTDAEGETPYIVNLLFAFIFIVYFFQTLRKILNQLNQQKR